MDPNQTLAEIRKILATLTVGDTQRLAELADKIEDLDEWLSDGGFPPDAWNLTRVPF